MLLFAGVFLGTLALGVAFMPLSYVLLVVLERSAHYTIALHDWVFDPWICERPAPHRELVLAAPRLRKSLRKCPFCHEFLGLDPDEGGECDRCETVLHEACWRELGRCPVLGCPGRARATFLNI